MASAKALRAAEHLRAVELSDGDWAHYDDNMQRWYVVDVDDLENLTEYLDSEDPHVVSEAYSLWCAQTTCDEMPKGWSPSAPNIYTGELLPFWAGAACLRWKANVLNWGSVVEYGFGDSPEEAMNAALRRAERRLH